MKTGERDLFGNVPQKEIPIMPHEYIGKVGKGCGYTKSLPRLWTAEEIAWIEKMRREGYSNEEIGLSTGRTATSIEIKFKRLGKQKNKYNLRHLDDKYARNRDFADIIHPSSILDLYCGKKSFWKNSGLCEKVVTNDSNVLFEADYHEKAEMLIHDLYYKGFSFDVVDLDPFGSAFECFDLSVKMAKRGLIVTFGEMGHKRWKRLDFVRRYYRINKMGDFTLPNLVRVLEEIANRNKKHLEPIIERQWDRVARVWFRVDEIKITEQWA